jgi:hypothetical protein
LNPTAVRVDVGENLDGMDYGVGSDFDAAGVVNDVAECAADVTVATVPQAGGVRVAIERAARDVIVRDDVGDGLPHDERFVDFLPEFAGANAAMGLMELQARQELAMRATMPWFTTRSLLASDAFSFCFLDLCSAGSAFRMAADFHGHGRLSGAWCSREVVVR